MTSIDVDYSINPWLKTVDLNKNNAYLNKLLNLGKQVSDMAEISVNPNSNFLEPINQKVHGLSRDCQTTYEQMVNLSSISNNNINVLQNRLNNLDSDIKSALSIQYDNVQTQCTQLANVINKLTGNVSNSSIKGQIGENFLESLLKTNFPDDIIKVMAQTGREADIHLESKVNPKILIESKLYKNCVTTKELEKFYNDLDRTGINYGVFVSLTSNITKHRRLEFERRNGKNIIYIPNAGFDGINVIYGILFLREVEKLCNSQLDISPQQIQEKCKVIYESVKNLDEIFELISRMRNDTIRTKNNIDKSMSELVTNVLKIEVATKDIISKLKQNITKSLSELNTQFSVYEKDQITELLDNFRNSSNKFENKLADFMVLLLENAQNVYEDEACKKDKKLVIFNNRGKFCELKIGKTKAICIFLESQIKMDIKKSSDLSQFKKILDCIID